MSVVDDFWKPWESEIVDFAAIDALITKLSKKWVGAGRQFAWRGVIDASWPLHSSLYRRLYWSYLARGETTPPDEAALYEAETTILADAHRWGLHSGERGRLSILAELATLQHFGTPTRLIDVTLNAYIGLWFAVEKADDTDGRLFAIDITSRLINESDRREWEDVLSRPWKADEQDQDEWCTTTFAWKPPPFEARIAAQNGAFLFGGVPITKPRFQFPKGPTLSTTWAKPSVRRCTSLHLRMHKANPRAGGVHKTGSPAYTFRIDAAAKAEIRERLEAMFGYSHKTIYPDFPGFATFGTDLPVTPPSSVASGSSTTAP
jgi:hypothetical protein